MSGRLSEFTRSLRELGDLQVNDWDFRGFMNTELKDLELGESLRKLGNKKVLEWDFRSAMHKFAHDDVDLVGLMRRAAHYQVLEWDFHKARPQQPGPAAMQALIERLGNFIQFVVAALIDEPDRAQLKVAEIAPGVIRFRLVVAQSDVKDLIGRNGDTAAALRKLVKSAAVANGTHALLEILSHEEELERSRGEDA